MSRSSTPGHEDLTRALAKAGLTQKQLAEVADLHWTFLSRVERGLADISVGNLLKIAAATGVLVRDLVREL